MKHIIMRKLNSYSQNKCIKFIIDHTWMTALLTLMFPLFQLLIPNFYVFLALAIIVLIPNIICSYYLSSKYIVEPFIASSSLILIMLSSASILKAINMYSSLFTISPAKNIPSGIYFISQFISLIALLTIVPQLATPEINTYSNYHHLPYKIWGPIVPTIEISPIQFPQNSFTKLLISPHTYRNQRELTKLVYSGKLNYIFEGPSSKIKHSDVINNNSKQFIEISDDYVRNTITNNLSYLSMSALNQIKFISSRKISTNLPYMISALGVVIALFGKLNFPNVINWPVILALVALLTIACVLEVRTMGHSDRYNFLISLVDEAIQKKSSKEN